MSRGASRSAAALAEPTVKTHRFVEVPHFDDNHPLGIRGADGTVRLYSTRVFICRYCGDYLPEVIVAATEDGATYHNATESVLIENDPGCPACAAILVPTPLFVKVAGWRVLFGDLATCCVVARIRKYADSLWAKDLTHLSDQWEAWAARLAKNSSIMVAREHVPGNCRNI